MILSLKEIKSASIAIIFLNLGELLETLFRLRKTLG